MNPKDRCGGVLLGLAAGDRNGGPIQMAVRLAESLVARWTLESSIGAEMPEGRKRMAEFCRTYLGL